MAMAVQVQGIESEIRLWSTIFAYVLCTLDYDLCPLH